MAVHCTSAGVFAKDMLLRQALKACEPMQKMLALAPPGAPGYAMIITRLEEKFGGARKTLDFQLQKLKRIPPVQLGQAEALEELIDTVHAYQAGLVNQGYEQASTHSYHALVLSKLAPELRIRFHAYQVDHPVKEETETEALLTWMAKYLLGPWRREPQIFKKKDMNKSFQPRRPELKEHLRREERPRSAPEARQFQAQSKSPRPCPMCEGPHYLGKCLDFQALKLVDRENVVIRKQLCYRCLQPGHAARSCKKAFTCAECKGWHHTLIHGNRWKARSRDRVDLLKQAGQQNARLEGNAHQAKEQINKSITVQDQQALQGDHGLPPDKVPNAADLERLAQEIPDDVQFYYYRCYQADTGQESISLRFAVVNLENP